MKEMLLLSPPLLLSKLCGQGFGFVNAPPKISIAGALSEMLLLANIIIFNLLRSWSDNCVFRNNKIVHWLQSLLSCPKWN